MLGHNTGKVYEPSGSTAPAGRLIDALDLRKFRDPDLKHSSLQVNFSTCGSLDLLRGHWTSCQEQVHTTCDSNQIEETALVGHGSFTV